MNTPVVDFMLHRSSVPASMLGQPGPTDAEIETMIRIASRVPDHGRLEPWRFILYRGEVCKTIGEKLAALAAEREGPLDDARRDKELNRFCHAPLVIGVVSSPKEHASIPQWEMFLSAGSVTMNLLIAANGLGYGANWVTHWYSDIEEGRRILGVAPHERIAGLVHIGSFSGTMPERPRPEISGLYAEYPGPWPQD